MASEKPKESTVVRRMLAEDLAAVAILSEQLGYPVSIGDLTDRFVTMSSSSNHHLAVALLQGILVGWCHVFCVELLETGGYAELGGLVVDEDWRRKRVGHALVLDAETWARSRGLPKIRAYSGNHRETAHRFYRAEGFEQGAPAMFQKIIIEPTATTPRKEQVS